MKNISIILLLFTSFCASAQIKGNKKIVTRTFEISSFESLYLGLYAQYEIDMDSEPALEITIDENLIPYVERQVNKGILTLNQLKWISPSQNVIIKIGAKGLKELTQSAHSRTKVQNIDQEKLKIIADVGDIFLEGKVNMIDIQVGTADVDASKLDATNGKFAYESWGKIIANISGDYEAINENSGKLTLNGKSAVVPTDESIRFIKFVLRNNSANRHHFYVIGPKPDGSNFSYGFPMMPFQKRDKDWTNGTKVYKVNSIGLKELVKVISLEDEGETLNIFEK